MKVVVCVKMIKATLLNSDAVGLALNPYDLFALRQCEKLKETNDIELYAICMGPKSGTDIIQRIYAMGADKVVLISDSVYAGSDTVATSCILYHALKQIDNINLICCGQKAVDGETGQVPYGIAERLGVNFIDGVKNIEMRDNNLIISRNNEKESQLLVSKLPLMVIFDDFMTDSSVSLLKLKKSKSMTVEIWNNDVLKCNEEHCGESGSKTKVLSVRNSYTKKSSCMIGGDSFDQARQIISIINGGM